MGPEAASPVCPALEVPTPDRDEPQRARILTALRDEPDDRVVPAPTTAEVDYLLGQRAKTRVADS